MTPQEPYEQAQDILAQLKRGGRKALKRLTKELEPASDELRIALMNAAQKEGTNLPVEAQKWPIKKLLRRSLGRDFISQVRKNPIARDEDFTCLHCGTVVHAHGRTARDHCHHCLTSRHLDIIPGDRQSSCEGLMDATGLEIKHGKTIISYRCRLCGHEGRVQALQDGTPPDSAAAINRLSARMSR